MERLDRLDFSRIMSAVMETRIYAAQMQEYNSLSFLRKLVTPYPQEPALYNLPEFRKERAAHRLALDALNAAYPELNREIAGPCGPGQYRTSLNVYLNDEGLPTVSFRVVDTVNHLEGSITRKWEGRGMKSEPHEARFKDPSLSRVYSAFDDLCREGLVLAVNGTGHSTVRHVKAVTARVREVAARNRPAPVRPSHDLPGTLGTDKVLDLDDMKAKMDWMKTVTARCIVDMDANTPDIRNLYRNYDNQCRKFFNGGDLLPLMARRAGTVRPLVQCLSEGWTCGRSRKEDTDYTAACHALMAGWSAAQIARALEDRKVRNAEKAVKNAEDYVRSLLKAPFLESDHPVDAMTDRLRNYAAAGHSSYAHITWNEILEKNGTDMAAALRQARKSGLTMDDMTSIIRPECPESLVRSVFEETLLRETRDVRYGMTVVKDGSGYHLENMDGMRAGGIYDHIRPSEDYGLFVVKREDDGKRNFIDCRGREISPAWFDSFGETREGVKVICADGLFNLLGMSSGRLLCGDDWCSETRGFQDGWAVIKAGPSDGEECRGKYNWINHDGALLSARWFDDATSFSEGRAVGVADGQRFTVRENGEVRHEEIPEPEVELVEEEESEEITMHR